MNQWQSDVIEINGLRLHYTQTGGDKPPLVLARGFSEDDLVWTTLATQLEDRYDVIMPDARGHGWSDAAETGLGPAELAYGLAAYPESELVGNGCANLCRRQDGVQPSNTCSFHEQDTGASNVHIIASPTDWPTLLRHIQCPALLITGDVELGAMVSASQTAVLEEQVPTLRVAHIANASHDVRRDQSEDFLAAITPFLTEWARDRVS